MPETRVPFRWPDGAEDQCYSPSRVIAQHLRAGESLPLDEFMAAARKALEAASDRVREVYGAPCGRAAAELSRLERIAAGQAPGLVRILPSHREAAGLDETKQSEI